MAEEMDPCECLWSHEITMRRLLALLRENQQLCTDFQCLEETALPEPTSVGSNFIIMFVMMAIAMGMYMMRPRRNQIQDSKPVSNFEDRDGSPPPPPRV